jgi:hypothetical protein
MWGACVAGLLALSFVAAGELEEDDGVEGVDAVAEEGVEDARETEAGDPEDLEVASLEAEAGLPPAPGGAPLRDGAPILLERRERPDGTALERLVEPSGEVVLHEVSRAGTVLSCRTAGRLLTLRVIEQREAAGGEVVQVARDASGALLRYVVAADGEPRAVTVVAPALR